MKDAKYQRLSSIAILPGNSAGNAKALYDLVLERKIDKMDKVVYLLIMMAVDMMDTRQYNK